MVLHHNIYIGLANISENDLEGIKNQRKNLKYKPPEPVIRPIDFQIILNKLIINMVCLSLIILLCILAINTFHETSSVYRSVESAIRVHINERFMHNVSIEFFLVITVSLAIELFVESSYE